MVWNHFRISLNTIAHTFIEFYRCVGTMALGACGQQSVLVYLEDRCGASSKARLTNLQSFRLEDRCPFVV